MEDNSINIYALYKNIPEDEIIDILYDLCNDYKCLPYELTVEQLKKALYEEKINTTFYSNEAILTWCILKQYYMIKDMIQQCISKSYEKQRLGELCEAISILKNIFIKMNMEEKIENEMQN